MCPLQMSEGRQAEGINALASELTELKRQIEASRFASIKVSGSQDI